MDFIQAQQAVVVAVAGDVPYRHWERILLDVEIAEQTDGYDLDTVSIVIRRNERNELEDPQFRLGAESKEAITRLYEQRKQDAGEVIGGFELSVDFPGKFRFAFSHDKPKRLNGVWDAERQRRLDDYLSIYKAEVGAD